MSTSTASTAIKSPRSEPVDVEKLKKQALRSQIRFSV